MKKPSFNYISVEKQIEMFRWLLAAVWYISRSSF